jgi:hypothetical protein
MPHLTTTETTAISPQSGESSFGLRSNNKGPLLHVGSYSQQVGPELEKGDEVLDQARALKILVADLQIAAMKDAPSLPGASSLVLVRDSCRCITASDRL